MQQYVKLYYDGVLSWLVACSKQRSIQRVNFARSTRALDNKSNAVMRSPEQGYTLYIYIRTRVRMPVAYLIKVFTVVPCNHQKSAKMGYNSHV